MPRPSSATDSRRPTDCTADARIVIRRAREWRTALVSASCAMPMISRSTASPRRGSSSTTRSIGVFAVRCPMSARRLSAAGDVLALADVRAKRADRAPRLRQVRARQVDRGLDARRDRGGSGRRSRAAPPAAASESRRIPAPGCRECRARADCAPRESPCGALRGDWSRSAGCDAARARPDAPSPRSAPRATTESRARSPRDSTPSSIRGCGRRARAASR